MRVHYSLHTKNANAYEPSNQHITVNICKLHCKAMCVCESVRYAFRCWKRQKEPKSSFLLWNFNRRKNSSLIPPILLACYGSVRFSPLHCTVRSKAKVKRKNCVRLSWKRYYTPWVIPTRKQCMQLAARIHTRIQCLCCVYTYCIRMNVYECALFISMHVHTDGARCLQSIAYRVGI